MSISIYQPPVSKLLDYGDCRKLKEWPDYVGELNFTAQHIPELIAMATDEELSQADSDNLKVWSPVHAWRALGQLKTIDALPSLLQLLANRDDDWISGDFSQLCTLIGLEAIPLLEEFLADTANNLYARIDAASSLQAISEEHPETRESCIAAIAGELEKFEDNDPTFNALLICELIDLQAIATLPIMEKAFEADRVAIFISGDLHDIRVEFGLEKRAQERRNIQQQMFDSLFFTSPSIKSKSKKGFGANVEKTKKKKSRNKKKKK